ncbi:hypothetical protein KR222_002098 [Zaprionus bogoriensis]|nr:hypothetical protein KR222_002098 [Zaprionus bogoriensis]
MIAISRVSSAAQQLCRRTIIGTSRKYSQCGDAKTFKITMVRHGESEWNKQNLFCGWFDAELSEKGMQEACAAGKAIKDENLVFEVAHTSLLKRANDTLTTLLTVSDQPEIVIFKSWRLNERHYGGLTGLNKAETAKKYGEEQVQIWRRSFNTPPPHMEKDHKFYTCITKDPRYVNINPCDFPNTESLKMTIERTLPYWNDIIVPQIKNDLRIIISAHGNSLRGIIKHLDNISDEDIMELNLPTGIPFVYELDECMHPVSSFKFLGDPETVKKAMEAVAKQGKAK